MLGRGKDRRESKVSVFRANGLLDPLRNHVISRASNNERQVNALPMDQRH